MAVNVSCVLAMFPVAMTFSCELQRQMYVFNRHITSHKAESGKGMQAVSRSVRPAVRVVTLLSTVLARGF